MNKLSLLSSIAASVLTFSASASSVLPSFMERTEESSLQYQVSLGYSAGGEKIGPAISDAYGQSQVSAGSGLMLGAGFSYNLPTNYPMFLAANLHVMADHASSNESEVTFTRIPMDFMLGSQYRKFRFAGGLTHHMNPTLEYKWDNDDSFDKEESTSKSYGAATGQVAEISYNIERVDLNLRYTNIEYNFAGVKVDGSGMAVSLMLRF